MWPTFHPTTQQYREHLDGDSNRPRINIWYKSVYKSPKCQKIHFEKWTKLVKLSFKEIIGIFAIYQFRLLYCTFWQFAPKPSPLFTYICAVAPKIDCLPHGTSSSWVHCVVGGCFRGVVVMCSEFMGHRA